ncbi:GAF and ANTAR domain-containing protein [Umezawaea sp.]|uniref:GAF and ANTAR domain-containing protein n=1 Tax=Umezawaea sp. TaxID=1955258 RepID=UPI002ED442AD
MRLQPDSASPGPLDEVRSALLGLTKALDGDEDFQVLLQSACEQVVTALPEVRQATITLLDHGKARTAAATSDLVQRLDQDQYRIGDGPCLHASRTGELVRATAREAIDRWPDFGRDAHAAGFGSFLSAPLVVEEGFSGAVNCYGASDGGFVELDGQALALYSTAVEAILRAHRQYALAKENAEHLRRALASRAVIDQAKGVIMAVRRVDADSAFRILAEQSQRQNKRLHEVATQFIAEVSRPVG